MQTVQRMKKQGFSSKERILTPAEYKNTYNRGRLLKKEHFWCYCLPNKLMISRLGISASNKNCANIVQRNKIKKIIKEIFRHNKQKILTKSDLVVVLKKPIARVVFKKIEEEILVFFKPGNHEKSSNFSNKNIS